MSLLISANKLTHSYGGRTLFTDVSCGIFEKDKIGLIGPNGAGKSTLFKIMSQKLKADSGDVTQRRGLRVGLLNQDVFMDDSKSWFDHLLETESDYAILYETLSKFQLTAIDESLKFSECSGGLQKRIGLAEAILMRPDVLFLDEPTNHLDVHSIIWLEDYLKDSNLTYVIITHDRLFLERTCEKIFDLDRKNPKYLLTTDGDLATHLEKKEQLISDQKSTASKLKNTLTRETEWLRRGAIARQTKQKFRIENAGVIKSELETIKERVKQKSLEFDFGEQRAPKKLIEIESLDFSFSGREIFNHLDLLISGTTRLGILGPNGAGKSTLLKLITGDLEPQSGTIKRYPDLKISYFEQSKNSLLLNVSLLKNICPQGDYVHFKGEAIYAKSYLERFGFNYDQMDLPVEKLSGGEKSRLRIAQLMLEDSQLLILDEPTNDLDFDTLNSLQEALEQYPGGVLLVSHDRFFMDRVSTKLLVLDFDETPQTFTDYYQWEDYFSRKKILESKAEAITKTSEKSKEKKGLSFKEQREFDGMEAEIAGHEKKLLELELEAQSPDVLKDSKKVYEAYVQSSELKTKIDQMYARWQELEQKKS